MKPTIDDFITFEIFRKMTGLTERQLRYRISRKQVIPPPCRFGTAFVFDENAKILIPPRPKPTGRPKGTTIANGAKRHGYPRKRDIKKKTAKKRKKD